jgi:hypothetical protein
MLCDAMRWTALLFVSALIAGCSRPASEGPLAPSSETAAARSKYLLREEPAGAKGVIELRKAAQNEDEVVVVGRIGGDVNPWVEGLAAFLIADSSLKPCNEIEGDACETPWDYCCESDLNDKKATVRLVDEQGETVAIDSRKLLGVKELATVVVRGKALRDEAGNLTILATGVFMR